MLTDEQVQAFRSDGFAVCKNFLTQSQVDDLLREADTALDAVVCGGCWFHGRGDLELRCFRCKEAEDTPWHAYRGCPELHKHQDKHVAKSNGLRPLFCAG